MSQADFDKFLKLEKRLGKLIDNPTGSSSRALMKRKENLRRRLKILEPKIKGFEEGGDVAKPKAKPKNFKKTVEKQKRDKAIASGDMTIGDFNEMTPSMMQDFYKNASKVKKMELGGEAVPSKFKGFSKLPEGVQQNIDPKLASKYKYGGKVKKMKYGGSAKGGKMGCRGMGAALRGGGYTIS